MPRRISDVTASSPTERKEDAIITILTKAAENSEQALSFDEIISRMKQAGFKYEYLGSAVEDREALAQLVKENLVSQRDGWFWVERS